MSPEPSDSCDKGFTYLTKAKKAGGTNANTLTRESQRDVLNAAIIEADDYMLAQDFVAYVPETDARLTIWGNDLALCHVKVRDVETVGGERLTPWIRIRNFVPT